MIQMDQIEKLDVLISQSIVHDDEENNMGFKNIGTIKTQERRYQGWSKKIFVFCFMMLSVLLVSILGVVLRYRLMNSDDWEFYGSKDLMMENNSSSSSSSSSTSSSSTSSSSTTFKDILRHSEKKSGGELLSYFKNNLDIISDHFYDDDCGGGGGGGGDNKTLWVSDYYDIFNKFIREIQKQEIKGKKSKIEILTKNVQVLKNAHSHNDYWRKLPVFEAMLYGIKSIEADIWTIDNLDIGYNDCIESSSICDILAVGHDVQSLRPLEKNLENLYLDPMVDYLDELNGNTESLAGVEPVKGLFHKAPEETMTLFIDFKQERTNIHTYEILINKYLNKEKYRKYLSYIDSKTNTLVINPITIILTGAYPVLKNSEYEDYIFLDLEIVDLLTTTNERELPPAFTISTSLSKLWKHCYRLDNKTRIDDNHDEISKSHKVSKKKKYYKYIYFLRTYLSKNPIKDTEFQCMKQEIDKIHKLPLSYKTKDGKTHLKTRIWDIPGSPIKKRNHYWKNLWKVVNFDYISVDNLGDFAHFVSIEK